MNNNAAPHSRTRICRALTRTNNATPFPMILRFGAAVLESSRLRPPESIQDGGGDRNWKGQQAPEGGEPAGCGWQARPNCSGPFGCGCRARPNCSGPFREQGRRRTDPDEDARPPLSCCLAKQPLPRQRLPGLRAESMRSTIPPMVDPNSFSFSSERSCGPFRVQSRDKPSLF